MKRAPFLPGCDPRHRSAALALYRTLIRQAHRVPLPEPQTTNDPRNPIAYLIRKRFASNRSCTSSRLVYAALAAGYQFIDVLAKARSSSSPEHARLRSHLQAHHIPPSRPHANISLPDTPTKREPRTGVLTKVVNRDGTYKYAPTHPPNQDPRWATRRLPHMARTSEDQTFIRFRKPQPVFLTRKLIKQRALSVRNVDKLKAVENEMMNAAKNEDTWEEIVRRQMELEGFAVSQYSPDDMPEESYRYSVAISRLWLHLKWETRWYDLVARGDGYQAFINEVAEVQKAHDAEPMETRQPRSKVSPSTFAGNRPTSPVRLGRDEVSYPLLTAVKKLTGRFPEGNEADPFAAPYWALLVRDKSGMLLDQMPPLDSQSGRSRA
jgi:hypothetical protein